MATYGVSGGWVSAIAVPGVSMQPGAVWIQTDPAPGGSVGPATHFSFSAPSNATVGTSFSITVYARDASNNIASGYAGTVHFTSTDGAASLPANSTLSGGFQTFTVTLNTAGIQTVTATDTVTGTITGTTGSITVAAVGGVLDASTGQVLPPIMG
jgi:hypothetical protein